MSAGTFFKTFSSADRTTTRTLLHENIPITGALLSGTYTTNTTTTLHRDENTKAFSHGMFQSVYDYPFLSSSANHLFDVTYGFSTNSGSLSSSATTAGDPTIAKKVNIYNQMAQVLVGYDTSGSVRRFDADGDLSAGAKIDNAYFINLSRLLVKDEIKKGSFSLVLASSSAASDAFAAPNDNQSAFANTITISDAGAATSYKVNSPAGEYGLLKLTDDSVTSNVGLIYYQAGIAVLDTDVITGRANHTHPGAFSAKFDDLKHQAVTFDGTVQDALTASGDFNTGITEFRRRVSNLSFNNTTELNSTIYFCRANHNEFNYSSNPSYLTGSKVRVKGDNILAPPKTYVTTVGLYSADNELLAVAKLSEPLKKDPTNELTLRVRLDY